VRNDRPKVLLASGAFLLAGVAAVIWFFIGLSSGPGNKATWLLSGLFAIFVGVLLTVILTKDPHRESATGKKPNAPGRAHLLEFTVGDREKHRISYRWDQVWGWLTVTVDGDLVMKQLVTYTFRLVNVVEFAVGEAERHAVRIEKRRPLLASFAQPQPINAFVDGVLVARLDGASAV